MINVKGKIQSKVISVQHDVWEDARMWLDFCYMWRWLNAVVKEKTAEERVVNLIAISNIWNLDD